MADTGNHVPTFLEATASASDERHSCGCCQDDDSSQNMVCLPPHVFAFCIVMSALVSAIVVASQRIHRAIREKLGQLLEPSRVHNPHLRHRSASRQLSKDSEGSLIMEAAEAMDRAAAAILEPEHKVPARYVRAFCGNEEHALERWKATLKWRKDNEIDSILNEPQPFFHDIRRYFPSHLCGRSRGGHIVVYEKLGGVDMRTLRRQLGVTVPMLLRHWIFVSEYMYRVLQPTDSAQQITIEDMKGVRMQTLAGKIQEYVKAAAQLARLHYVERCHKTFVVNAPAWFGLSFRVVSPFLSARTRQKIRVLGPDLSVLQDEIDPQYLPVEYGGTMTVPVSESTEERNLRRLVDAINANASADNTATTPQNGDSGGGAKGGRPSRPSPVTPPLKKSPKRTGKPAPVQRSPFRKDGAVAASHEQRQSYLSPKSNRLRARTSDAASGSARSAGSPPEQSQSPGLRRATWAPTGGRDSAETSQPADERKRQQESSALPESPSVVREERVGHDEGGSAGVGVGAEEGVVGGQDRGRAGRRGRVGEPPAYEDERRLEEDALPIEDRLQAVMKDLGVPLGEQDGVVHGRQARPEVEIAKGHGQQAGTGTPESTPAVAGAEGELATGVRGGAVPALEIISDNSVEGFRTPSAGPESSSAS